MPKVIIPADYNAGFLAELAGITNLPWGYAPHPEGQEFAFPTERYDETLAAIDAYPAAWLIAQKAKKIEQVAEVRKQRSQNLVFNGIPFKFDKDTEDAVAKAVIALRRQPEGTTIDWEVTRGVFITFDLPTLEAIGDAGFLLVQGCFTHAKNLVAAINAAPDFATLEAIDVNSGWPDEAPVE